MARQEALLRLHKVLAGRRDEILKKLRGDLDAMGDGATDNTGDEADAAFDAAGEEMASQLAELEARELTQIERALYRLRQGTYGQCEGCADKIPLGRLNALPYSTLCIKCKQEMEESPAAWEAAHGGGDWGKVADHARSLEEGREPRLADLEIDLSNR
jgi:DnaK suppressor protein